MSEMLYVDYYLEKDQKEYLDNLLGKCGIIKGNSKVTYYLKEKQKEAIDALLNKEGIIIDDPNYDFSNGCYYFVVGTSGDIMRETWDNDPVDKARMNIGNAFKTKEEAEFACERLKVLAKMRKYALPRNSVRSKYHILTYYIPTNSIKVIDDSWYNFNDLAFESREAAMNCIDSVGKEKIIKYYFGVE